MNDFSSLKELYERLEPAINNKFRIIKKRSKYIKKIDIWNYLTQSKWNNKENLSLYEMVDDILNVNVKSVEEYVLSINSKEEKDITFTDDIL